MSIYENTKVSKVSDCRTIRLLVLSTSENDGLRGTLEVASLISPLSYYALSYVWGPFADPARCIKCSSADRKLCADLPITTNCHDALTQIRRSYNRKWPSGSSIRIWIDAICINQNDDAEKAEQIPLMEEIYGKANQVLIWLGKGCTSSDTAMDWIAQASLGQTPLLQGARWKPFPRNMAPSEAWKLVNAAPSMLRRGQRMQYAVS